MSEGVHRFDQLTDVVVDVVRDAGEQVPSEQYISLIKCLNVQKPGEFKSKFLENLMASVRKDLIADLGHSNRRLSELLDEVDEAETRAYERRSRHRSGEHSRREELPAKIYASKSKDSINCQLRAARQQWSQELRDRKKAAQEQSSALTRERDTRREKLVQKFQDVGVRITAFSKIYDDTKATLTTTISTKEEESARSIDDANSPGRRPIEGEGGHPNKRHRQL